MIARRTALLAVASLLAGCATRPPELAGMPWISGRLAVRIEATADEGPRSASAAFDLRGSAERGELRLLSPLGTLIAEARWSPNEASITTSDGQRRFEDLDTLSREVLGEVLPLRALPDWLAGRSWPGAASQLAEGGFEQLGWRVQTTGLADGLIEARRQAPSAVMLRARLDR